MPFVLLIHLYAGTCRDPDKLMETAESVCHQRWPSMNQCVNGEHRSKGIWVKQYKEKAQEKLRAGLE